MPSSSRSVGTRDRGNDPPRTAPTEIHPTEHDGPPLNVAVLGMSLGRASIDELETVARAITWEWVEGAWASIPGTEEVGVLRTCHRVELIVLVRTPEATRRWQELLPGPSAAWTVRIGPEAVHHVYRVSAGLESLAVGEREVREQVRRAAHSVRSRYPRPVLRGVLNSAVEAAETIAPDVPSHRSIAAVAATRLLEEVARPFPRVVVVGAGVVGRQLAEALASYARVTLLYRSAPPSEDFLRATGARAASVSHLSQEIHLSDAVVTAAKSGGRIIGLADLGDPTGPLLLIDLGVPRNVDPQVRADPRMRLLDLEDLRAGVVGGGETDTLERHVADRARASWIELERTLLEPWIDAVWRHGEAIRTTELETADRFLGSLTPEQRMAVDRMTRRLVAQLLREPTERVRELPPGAEADRLRRFALALYRIDPDGL